MLFNNNSDLKRHREWYICCQHQIRKLLNVNLYQWVVPLIALFYVVRLVNQYKVKKRLIKGTIFWFIFWVSISILAIIPDNISVGLAKVLGFKDNVNAIIFVGVFFQFLFLYYLSNTVERLERKVTDLVRKIAIEQSMADEKKKELVETDFD